MNHCQDEVIGKLWKAVDAFKISAADTDKHTQEQIAAWTETNLNLLKLLSGEDGGDGAAGAKLQQAHQLLERLRRAVSGLRGANQQFEQQLKGLETRQLRVQDQADPEYDREHEAQRQWSRPQAGREEPEQVSVRGRGVER